MSTSAGTPSRKIPWYQKMCAKIDHENRTNRVQSDSQKVTVQDRRKQKMEDMVAGK